MSEKFQAPRGTNDIIPGPRQKDTIFESHRWQYIEGEFLGTAWLYGYQEIRTPIFEDIELFLRTSGDASEIVSKEMYEFYDKGERHVALKPEGTAPVMRAYLEHGIGNLGGPTRLCYINHSFRYGRPGKGRYRQLHQLGMEIVGSDSPLADAEIIIATHDFFTRIGLASTHVMLNCIGNFETRTTFGEVILNHLKGYFDSLDEETQSKLIKNPIRLLDTKEEKLRTALEGLPPITDFLSAESKANFEQVQAALTQAGIPFTLDPGIVRGLDYYNDTVFEFVDDDLPGLSLCGGGRYDSLIEQIGGKATPSAGVGIGLERLLLTLEQKEIEIPGPMPDAFLIAATEEARPALRELAADLRASDFSVQLDIEGKNIKQQFKAADRANALYSLILGEDELKKGVVTVKNMATQNQVTVNRDEIEQWLLEATMTEEENG
ncbi:MAG: histidine--tRNA ligase [Fimbriimonadaceae bacterium]